MSERFRAPFAISVMHLFQTEIARSPALSTQTGFLIDTKSPFSGCSVRGQLVEPGEVDVSAAHYGNHFSTPALSAQRGSDRAGSGAFRDRMIAFGDQLHGTPDFVQGNDDRARENVIRQSPHAREYALAAAPVHPTSRPAGKLLRGPFGERKRQRRSGLRLRCKDFYGGLRRLHDRADPAAQPAPAKSGHNRIHVGEILQDLETASGVPGNEFVVFKRMHESARHGGMAPLAKGLPAFVEGGLDNFCAEPLDRGELRGGRGVHYENLAGRARPARRESHSLRGVPRADGPDARAAPARGQQANRVVSAADLERAD